MFDFGMSLMAGINRIIREGGKDHLTECEFMRRELNHFLHSPERRMMLAGESYFLGDQDIRLKERTAIGEDGQPHPVHNLPNSRLEDNQYRKMVLQKANYLTGKPVSMQSDDAAYLDALKTIFNAGWDRKLRGITESALNEGIAWVFPTYAADGHFVLRVFPGYEICPGWADSEHEVLEYAYRIYPVEVYEGKTITKTIWKIEVYTPNGIDYYETNGYGMEPVPCDPWHQDYLVITDEDGHEEGYNWSRIPLVPFRANRYETPLIKGVKSLQDAINTILSNFSDNMQEDTRNTILVLVNYDGENLGSFRQNLATYGAVKVASVDGVQGDVKTLQVAVNAENYKAILEILKKAIIENCMGYDAKDDRLSGTPNEMNIQSMYNDIDMDANSMETEFQASLEQLLWFVKAHLANIGAGSFDDSRVSFIFNRSVMMNQAEQINNARNSAGIISDETIMAHHPWVTDVAEEMERLQKQKEENLTQYGFGAGNPFEGKQKKDDVDEDDADKDDVDEDEEQ